MHLGSDIQIVAKFQKKLANQIGRSGQFTKNIVFIDNCLINCATVYDHGQIHSLIIHQSALAITPVSLNGMCYDKFAGKSQKPAEPQSSRKPKDRFWWDWTYLVNTFSWVSHFGISFCSFSVLLDKEVVKFNCEVTWFLHYKKCCNWWFYKILS